MIAIMQPISSERKNAPVRIYQSTRETDVFDQNKMGTKINQKKKKHERIWIQ